MSEFAAAGEGAPAAAPTGERPRMQLKPRSKAAGATGGFANTGSNNPFGAARPREEILKAKGVDVAKIDAELEERTRRLPRLSKVRNMHAVIVVALWMDQLIAKKLGSTCMKPPCWKENTAKIKSAVASSIREELVGRCVVALSINSPRRCLGSCAWSIPTGRVARRKPAPQLPKVSAKNGQEGVCFVHALLDTPRGCRLVNNGQRGMMSLISSGVMRTSALMWQSDTPVYYSVSRHTWAPYYLSAGGHTNGAIIPFSTLRLFGVAASLGLILQPSVHACHYPCGFTLLLFDMASRVGHDPGAMSACMPPSLFIRSKANKPYLVTNPSLPFPNQPLPYPPWTLQQQQEELDAAESEVKFAQASLKKAEEAAADEEALAAAKTEVETRTKGVNELIESFRKVEVSQHIIHYITFIYIRYALRDIHYIAYIT
jgi:hypothetical protein